MAKRLLSLRLQDIIEAIERVGTTLHDLGLEAFEADWEKRWLVERGVEIISEASRHLSPDLKARRTEAPREKVAAIGNIIRHAYDQVAAEVLWRAAHEDFPALYDVRREELVTALAKEGAE